MIHRTGKPWLQALSGFLLLAACTQVTPQEGSAPIAGESTPPVSAASEPLANPVTIEPLPESPQDPCRAANAQEAWLALGVHKPVLAGLVSSEIYFASTGTKMLAVSQQRRSNYGEENKTYVEISAELAERGSRVVSFSQVIATKTDFAEAAELYASLPPYWQQQVQDPQAVLVIKHHSFKKVPGFVKFENDIASDLAVQLAQGVELRCRSGEACKCM